MVKHFAVLFDHTQTFELSSLGGRISLANPLATSVLCTNIVMIENPVLCPKCPGTGEIRRIVPALSHEGSAAVLRRAPDGHVSGVRRERVRRRRLRNLLTTFDTSYYSIYNAESFKRGG